MEAMTAEAKAAVMQLMGETYGQQRKQDQMIVGSSGNLQPKSGEMKALVEQLVKSPTAPGKRQPQQPQQPQQPTQQPQQPPEQPPEQPQAAPWIPNWKTPEQVAQASPVSPEQAMAELQQVSVPEAEEQLGFDFSEPSQGDQVLAAIKENTLLLKAIKLQLDTSKVRPKRKSAKSKVAG